MTTKSQEVDEERAALTPRQGRPIVIAQSDEERSSQSRSCQQSNRKASDEDHGGQQSVDLRARELLKANHEELLNELSFWRVLSHFVSKITSVTIYFLLNHQ